MLYLKSCLFKNATHASSILGTLTASLALQDYGTAKRLIEADEFHEPYRQKLVPELVKIREIAHPAGSFCYLFEWCWIIQ